jgi:hypothetical protein
MKSVTWLFGWLLFGVIAVSGADITGHWVAQVQGQEEKHTIRFNLKADGDRVTGTEGRRNGEVEICDGSVKGNVITFTVARDIGDRVLVLDYKVTISDDKIEFTVKPRGPGWTTNMTATREKYPPASIGMKASFVRLCCTTAALGELFAASDSFNERLLLAEQLDVSQTGKPADLIR